MKKSLGADNYFAHPYCSWERGLNENHNGLIRQYLPKGMPLDKVTDEDISLIQNKLNNRPRKLLGYKTPNEVYDAMCLAA
jgi:IS30 family transposase